MKNAPPILFITLVIINLLVIWQSLFWLVGQTLHAAFTSQSLLAIFSIVSFTLGISVSLQNLLSALTSISHTTETQKPIEQQIFRTVLGIFFVTAFYILQTSYFYTLY